MENNTAQQKEFNVGDILYCNENLHWYSIIAVVMGKYDRVLWLSYDILYLFIGDERKHNRTNNIVFTLDGDQLQYLDVLV